MGQPEALAEGEVREDGLEGRFLGRAGIDAEADLSASLCQVGDTHLFVRDAILGALDAEVVLATAETIPHFLDGGRDAGRRPVGKAVVGDDASEMLEFAVLELDGSLNPVVAIEVEDHATLVETMMGILEGCLDGEGKELFLRLHLKARGVVVSEMIVGSLPKVRMGLGEDLQSSILELPALGFPDPREIVKAQFLHLWNSPVLLFYPRVYYWF